MEERPRCEACEVNGALVVTGTGMYCGECYGKVFMKRREEARKQFLEDARG